MDHSNGLERCNCGRWWRLVKSYWKDYIILVIFGALSIGMYVAPPAGTRLFTVTDPNTNSPLPLNENTAYPIKTEIVPLWLSALLSFIFSLVAFAGIFIKKRCAADFMAGLMGLFFSLAGSSFFQVVLKWLIGGVRPFFLEMCKPDMSKVQGQGFNHIYFDRSICTGDYRDISDALQSFPSGHSNAAWAGLLFLFFYLNGKLKLYSDRQVPYWKLLLVTSPILIASVISLTRLLDFTHNWYDILAGSIIGAIYSIIAYRMFYRSIWDYRTNHIPLAKLKEDLHYSKEADSGLA
ncbi:acid phosphatase/Vanadium-dependent haloperoxidase [Neoconidiobolus thromboides FSU 785]|nr:acid phosphatase/Vanadium-dependent haloperoxidase [Neoconidiobolus thromboides FSU 785]